MWWLFTTPFDRLPLPRLAVSFLVRILDFPVALAGELLYPIRGMELVFRDSGTWCDFCPVGEMFRQQMRIAIPTYLFLLYIPTLLQAVARRNTRLFKRIVMGLLIYAAFTAAYFLVTGDGNRRGDVRVPAMWFLILSVAAALAWSRISLRSKIIAVVPIECVMDKDDEKFMKMRDDEMELAFISDFVRFGARLSSSAALALLRGSPQSEVERKRLAAAILLQLYVALEDFAILLNAMITRREGLYLHLSMSKTAKQGTTQFPALLKKPVTAQEVFNTLGLDKVNVDLLTRIGYEITVSDLDASFADFAASVKQLGEYVDDYNSLKNRLKHGKAVFGLDFGLEKSGDVAHLEVTEEKAVSDTAGTSAAGAPKKLSLDVRFVRTAATDEQARVAVVTIAKLAKVSLDLLAIFVAHYYSEADAEKIGYLVKDQFDEIVAAVRSEGLSSKGLA